MSKLFSRLTLKKQAYCVLLNEFTILAPGGVKEFEHLNLEMIRGKARKVLQASVSAPSSTGLQK